jgi:hypothetical protein
MRQVEFATQQAELGCTLVIYQRKISVFFSCFCFAVLFTFFPFFNYLPLCIGLCRSGALPSTRLQLAGELTSALQPALT